MKRKSAFSLTEILIVIALIVLILGMAMASMNFITGSKSIDGATNQISAFLSRARTEAVGLQEARGVMFYIDPKTERQMMVLVKPTLAQPADVSGVTYIDALDADHLAIPKGVGCELVIDFLSNPITGKQITDSFRGYNVYPLTTGASIPVGGVILFDGFGKIICPNFGFRLRYLDPLGKPIKSPMAKLIDPSSANAPTDYLPVAPSQSAVGFALYDEGVMRDKFGSDHVTDSAYKSPPKTWQSDAQEQAEEIWINSDAQPYLINRYNGTLIKGG